MSHGQDNIEKGNLIGEWAGTLDVGQRKLPTIAIFKKSPSGEIDGELISVNQSSRPWKMTTVRETETGLIFSIKALDIRYEGNFTKDCSKIEGTFVQKGVRFPLVLSRKQGSQTFEPRRPQMPSRPFPYREREVSFPSAKDSECILKGTLTIPQGEGPFPAVILVTGSGLQDRDSTIFGHKPFLVLSDYLTRQGIAVLRFDDRDAKKAIDATHEDFAADAEGAFIFLKTQGEIDPKHIGFCGHSAGATDSFIVAAEHKDVAFVVSLAGMGVTLEKLTKRQRMLMHSTGSDEVKKGIKISNKVFEIIKERGGDTPEARKEVRALFESAGIDGAAVEAHMRSTFNPWVMGLFTYDPTVTFVKISCPVLVLNGGTDTQVFADENPEAIRDGIIAGGNKDVSMHIFPRLNHLFQQSATGLSSEYGNIEETMNPEVLKMVGDWILDKTGKHP